MKNLLTVGIVVAAILASRPASAQITNGGFETGDFTGWTTTGPLAPNPGSPSVTPGGVMVINGTPTTFFTPVQGNFEAFIQSTGGASAGQGVPNATLLTFLGVGALPGTPPFFDGTAIKQSFNITAVGGAKVSFAYAYQSRETVASNLDETGYVLNGNFTLLADTNSPGIQAYAPANGILNSFLPYQTTSVTVGQGANTLAFTSYNTQTTLSTTVLLIDNVLIIPLFGTVPGLTPNQQAVATYIDNHDLSTDPGFNALITALGGATTATALGDALDQLSPQSLQVYRRVAFDNSTFNTLDVTNHLANLRDGLTGFDPSQLNVTDSSMSPGASRIKNRLQDPKQMTDAKDMRDPKEMTAPPATSPDRWSTFIVGDVLLADLSHDEDMAHQDYTSASVMLGADYRLDDHFTVGALLAYSHTDADLDHIGSKATVDSYSPGVYASYVDGGWYGNGLFTYGYNTYTDDRQVAIGTFSGSNHGATDGNQYTGSLLGGYEFHTGDFKYGPFVGLQYVHLDINSFTEDGVSALNVESQSDDSLRTQLGFDVRYSARVGSTVLIPHASVAWQHECLDNSNGITSNFASVGGSPFTVQTTPVGRDSAVIDVGLDAGVCNNVTVFADYATQAGEEHYLAQSVSAGVRIGF